MYFKNFGGSKDRNRGREFSKYKYYMEMQMRVTDIVSFVLADAAKENAIRLSENMTIL